MSSPNITYDVLDKTKENIKPLKQGRKPIQLETALQAQSNTEIQQKLNKEKEQYERAIRTYDGDDPLFPRLEYIKWLEQIYILVAPKSNLLLLVEETVQTFKNDPKYKQDPRFIQILINYIEEQSNAVELYQTVYNQGIGTRCAIFYRAWADLLDRYNDFKRVDHIFKLGIQANAEPAEQLEEAHLQFQLSFARRMLNGQVSNNEEKNLEHGKRKPISVLKKSETHGGVRIGLGGSLGKVPLVSNVNSKTSVPMVFEDKDENGLFGVENTNYDLAQKGLNKENTVKPGPWTKSLKTSKTPKPVSTVNFEVHQDNADNVTKLPGITVPNALRRIKNNEFSCPVAVFEAPDPTKKPMYCKQRVYSAGRDIQLEEIRSELYLKNEKEKQEILHSMKNQVKEPLKNVLLPEENVNTNDFKVPPAPKTVSSERVAPDTLSQSVTVNTRVAIDLIQQMWSSPCTDKPAELISKEVKPLSDENVNNSAHCPPIFMVYEDNKSPNKNQANDDVLKVKNNKLPIQNEVGENMKPISEKNANNTAQCLPIFTVYEDNQSPIKNEVIENVCEAQQDKTPKNNMSGNILKRQQKITEGNNEVNDDMTCSTQAFAFLLSSSTPLAQSQNKTKSVTDIQQKSLKLIEEKSNECEGSQMAKSLSTILEASKERNSSTSSGTLTNYSVKKQEISTIDFGDSINPFDDELINKLLQKVIKFPNETHMSGYIKNKSDLPNMRSEFKLGDNKMLFLSELGKGSYARVVKVQSEDETSVQKALKIQKPSCEWEWYICKEIEYRLKDPEKISYFIHLDYMHIFKTGSIISMEYATYGTILSIVLNYKQKMNRPIPVQVGTVFISQITLAVKYLHQCQIIHGDLKPDNVVVKSFSTDTFLPCVQLIDFGRSIDMTLFPPKTSFTYSVKTADFICHEMRDNLPWTYQTDYFGLAGIIYLILMSDYMKTQKIRNVWMPMRPFPRYLDKILWNHVLNMLLNVESCEKQPNLDEITGKIKAYLAGQQKTMLNYQFNSFINTLKK